MGLVTGCQCAIRRPTASAGSQLMAGWMTTEDHTAKEVDMSPKTDVRLTPSQRLSRGLRYTAVGPVDVTRGTVGLSWQGAHSAASSLRQRVEKSQLAKDLAREFQDAQVAIASEIAEATEALANLPQTIAEARRPKRRPRPFVLA